MDSPKSECGDFSDWEESGGGVDIDDPTKVWGNSVEKDREELMELLRNDSEDEALADNALDKPVAGEAGGKGSDAESTDSESFGAISVLRAENENVMPAVEKVVYSQQRVHIYTEQDYETMLRCQEVVNYRKLIRKKLSEEKEKLAAAKLNIGESNEKEPEVETTIVLNDDESIEDLSASLLVDLKNMESMPTEGEKVQYSQKPVLASENNLQPTKSKDVAPVVKREESKKAIKVPLPMKSPSAVAVKLEVVCDREDSPLVDQPGNSVAIKKGERVLEPASLTDEQKSFATDGEDGTPESIKGLIDCGDNSLVKMQEKLCGTSGDSKLVEDAIVNTSYNGREIQEADSALDLIGSDTSGSDYESEDGDSVTNKEDVSEKVANDSGMIEDEDTKSLTSENIRATRKRKNYSTPISGMDLVSSEAHFGDGLSSEDEEFQSVSSDHRNSESEDDWIANGGYSSDSLTSESEALGSENVQSLANTLPKSSGKRSPKPSPKKRFGKKPRYAKRSPSKGGMPPPISFSKVYSSDEERLAAGSAVRKANLRGSSSMRNTPVSRSTRAGLQFPIGKIHREMKNLTRKRTGGNAAIYVAAVLEYITAEVVELAGNAAKDMKTRLITPRHMQLAIRGDEELDVFIKAIIPGGGVFPHIHKFLLQKKQ